MGRALVTGASGHLGCNLVRALIETGVEVVAFVRETSDRRGLAGLGVEFRTGDVLDAGSLARAAEGCDLMFHTAAVYAMGGVTEAEVVEPAVRGTKNAFAAARSAGIGRVIYTSSTFSVGFAHSAERLLNEGDWNQDLYTPYAKAKVGSERLAHEMARSEGIEVVVLNPAGLVGPYDFKGTPSTRVLMHLLNGRGLTGRGGGGLADIVEVARAHFAAATRGRSGERYILGGEATQQAEMGRIIGDLTGTRPLHLPVPRPMALATVWLLERIHGIAGSESPVTYQGAKSWVGRWGYYDSGKAERELGYRVADSRATYLTAASWLAHLGKLEPQVAERIQALYPGDPNWPAVEN